MKFFSRYRLQLYSQIDDKWLTIRCCHSLSFARYLCKTHKKEHPDIIYRVIEICLILK